MNLKDYEIAKKLKKRLSETTNVLDFRVFGSRVKDTQHEHSDMDVYVEVDYLDKELSEKILDIVWEVGFENYVVISPLVCTKEEVENTPLRSSPIIKNIYVEGVRV